MPKPSAYAGPRQAGFVVGGLFFVLGLGALIFLSLSPGESTLGGTLLLCGATIACGVVLGWVSYAAEAPSVLTLDGDLIRLRGPLLRRNVPTMLIQEIVRGRTGRYRTLAYRFERSKGGWLLGDMVILASRYDREELERLIAATGRPVTGDFTELV